MSKEFAAIPAGELLTVTTGVYSDYTVHGVFLACRDIDAAHLLEQWLSEHPDQREEYCFKEGEFLGWAVKAGYVKQIDCFEWHLGDYSTSSEMEVTKLDRDTSLD